jgi:glycosyltransferase involved in cell wall biosynthesis
VGSFSTGVVVRVGLIIYGDLEILTGGFLYDRMLVNYLRSCGDEVEVINIPWRTYVPHLWDNLSPSLFRRLRDAKIDILIQDELAHPSLFLLNRWLKNRVQYPIVALVHLLRCSEAHPAWLNRFYSIVERQYLSTVAGAIFNCNTTRATVERLMGRSLQGVVAYPGSDHLHRGLSSKEREERARKAGPLQIISIANVLPNKGLSVLIGALTRLPRESWRLRVAGSLAMDSAYVRAVRNQIAQAGLSEQVKLLGVVPNDEMPALLAKSDVLVVPSYYEAFAIAYLEAMRFGLPVIASTAGGARELICDGQEGYLISPGDTSTLAHCLREVAQDRERLLQMSLAAYRRINAHPTWAESLGRIRVFIQTLASAKGHINPATARQNNLIQAEKIPDSIAKLKYMNCCETCRKSNPLTRD